MVEFLYLVPPADALASLLSHLSPSVELERVQTTEAVGRVLAEDIRAPFPLPSFPRSTVDGYAVIAADTHGASDSLPAYLSVAGEVAMGQASQLQLGRGMCSLIHTGGMLPPSADAIVMIENTQAVKEGEVEVFRPAAPGENVIQVGEDVAEGELVLVRGARLRAAEVGGAAALGITDIRVASRPRVGIISGGDEIVAPGDHLGPGQVFDINTYTLTSLILEAGGAPIAYGIAEDTFSSLSRLAEEASRDCDVVVLTAGSSLSSRDLTSRVIQSLGEPGVLVHGVNIRPGKPTILGVCRGKPVVGLPGNPASALIIARLFVIPIVEALLGLAPGKPRPTIEASLQVNINSASGREDYVPVRLKRTEGGWVAEPVFGKSNLIFTLVKADGLLRISAEVTGMAAGERVSVELI